MKLKLFLFSLVCLSIHHVAQSQNAVRDRWDVSASCHINANERIWAAPYWPSKRASVRVSMVKDDGTRARCTGTLVNQATATSQLRQILILSRHCLTEGSGPFSDIDINFNSAQHAIIFHYQSPDATDAATPQNNRGRTDASSTLDLPSGVVGVDNGFRYLLRTSLTKIEDHKWGDYAVLEINEPIPPHFNPWFSGYQTERQREIDATNPLVGFHHPRGDIKKLAKYPFFTSIDFHTRACHFINATIDYKCNHRLFIWLDMGKFKLHS